MRNSFIEFSQLLSEDSVIPFLTDVGLLSSGRACSACGSECCLQKYAQVIDGWVLRCKACRVRSSIRRDTFFDGSKLPLHTIMLLVFGFVTEMPVTAIGTFAGCSERTAIDWYNFLRDVCISVVNNQGPLGGPGLIVEIDETVIAKRKYRRGRLVHEKWVWGAYCVTSKQGFCVEVDSRRAADLVPTVLQHVASGSILHADCFSSYNSLSQHYTLRRVNHSLHFVDPRTSATTNHVESFWGRIKRHLRTVNGSQGDMTARHVAEAVYRLNHRLITSVPWMTRMTTFINHLKQFYVGGQAVNFAEAVTRAAFFDPRGSTTLSSPSSPAGPLGRRRRASSSGTPHRTVERQPRRRRIASATNARSIQLQPDSLQDGPTSPRESRRNTG